MRYFSVTLTFDKPIPKTSIKKLKKEIYDKIFRVELLIKSIYFSKSDISCKGDKSFIKFRSDYDNSEKTLTPKITTALKGSAWSRLYLDDSLKAIKLDVDVKKTKKTKKTKKKGGSNKMSVKKFKQFLQGKENEYEKVRQTCGRTCSKMKTNYAKNKKQLTNKKKCYDTCEKERIIKIHKIHNKYPKEFKRFIKGL